MSTTFHALIRAAVVAASTIVASAAWGQVPVTPNADHERMLASTDPALAANKRLVYDFWREVFEGGQLVRVDRYMAETYIQHNPNVPTGRAGFVEFFRQFSKPVAVEPRVKAPLVAILAERDMVVLSFVSEQSDPKDAAKKYTTTWFDMFRIENGRIAEHWDPALRR